jgi:hypothetical protein
VRKTRVLLVGSAALSSVIRHLFRARPEFEVVGCVPGLKSLAQQAAKLLPELIVASVKPVGASVCAVVVAIKQTSPLSKLILICPFGDLLQEGRRCGADACLDHDRLVQRLLPTASALSARH